MIVEEIMTSNVRTVEETTSIGNAMEVLTELDARHLPVVRNREVTGMLSDRDLRSLGLTLVTDEASLEKLTGRLEAPVSTLMSGDVVSIDRAADLTEAIDVMLEERVGALPVVETDTNDLVGILSYVDILQALRETL